MDNIDSSISSQPDSVGFNGKILNLLKKLKPDNLRDWKKIIIVLVIIVSVIFLVWAIASKTSGEIATLSLSPSTYTAVAGQDFNINLVLDTRNNNVVAVKGVVKYNPNDFELRNWSTNSSVFASGNTCVYNSKPCEIVNNDTANGSITITEAKPTPGVNTSSGQLAVLTFRAKHAISNASPNLTIYYTAYGKYDDSDVVLDSAEANDILSEVSNATVNASLPVPTGLTAAAASATGINLSWNAPSVSVGVTGYKIFRNNEQIGVSASTTYSDTKLNPLTSYQYKISAIDSSGHESVQTTQVSATTLADTTKPTKPTGLTSSNIEMDSLDLAWSASADDVGIAGYNIYQGASKIGTITTTNYHITGLLAETTYVFSVAAFDTAGNESDHSDSISPKTSADTEAPTTPGNVSAQAVSINQINLSWNLSTDNVGVAGYNIYRNGSKINTSTSANYQDKGLNVAMTYNYQITAFDAKGNESDKSSQASATTNSDTEAPSVPTNLAASVVSMTEVSLSWNASTDNIGIVGYRIFRNGTQVGISTATTYKDTGLTKSTTYSYTVLAYDAAGNASTQTLPASVTTLNDTQVPTVPGGLSGVPDSMTEITLNWNASTDNIGVIGYRLYRNGTMIKDLAETTYKDISLTAGTTYSYAVSAYDADGNESVRSSSISVATLVKKYSLSDFANLATDWLQTKASPADVSNDGIVNSKDLGIMMHSWE